MCNKLVKNKSCIKKHKGVSFFDWDVLPLILCYNVEKLLLFYIKF